ncbi:hypothetical protein [uncultured Croceitalea sp.]|uniref:hypothetical protein n=1 Tax=uncultured Croceitalea sp. TaxID=1798908 RepID=UPI0033065DFE
MPHPKIHSNTITFTEEFAIELNLTRVQITSIDELTYEFFKTYQFSTNPNYNEENEREKYEKSTHKILNANQKVRLKEIKEQSKEHNESSYDDLRFQNLKNKYGSLGLSESKFKAFSQTINDVFSTSYKKWNPTIANEYNINSKHDYYLMLLKEKLSEFLGKQQLEEFLNIEASEQKWLIEFHTKRIKEANPLLGLNKTQAEKIFEFEENEFSIDCNGEYYSEFEKWEQRESFMHSVLDSEQFQEFQKQLQEVKNHHVLFIQESNKSKIREIEECKSLWEYLIKTYLPEICTYRRVVEENIPKNLKSSLILLRANYHDNLEDSLKESIQVNKRHNLHYYPNEIVYSRLSTKIRALIPSPYSLSDKQIDFLNIVPAKLKKVLTKSKSALKSADGKLHEFMITNYETHGGTYSGSTYVVRQNRKEEMNMRCISMLLLLPSPEENIKFSNKFN